MQRNLFRKYEQVEVSTTGPSSYAAGGFNVTVGRLRKIVKRPVVSCDGGYKAEVASVSDNVVTIVVKYYDYDAAADGTAIEVPDGTDLSGVNFEIKAEGY